MSSAQLTLPMLEELSVRSKLMGSFQRLPVCL